ncbi:type II secretion system F family protein [Photobacterium sanctipauli]|uniref:Type II secretion system F family protein n=1 Tax=Photobacterium sanctipauli TaxID=1342794 RepID=A0A2T3NPZ8_9GAMM|nr:type II secretion system F family protein [Photobacterium sanctipauli]PSW18339.1 type II secretion system F family protein [Photobacterium sanctipauli]
MIYLIISALLLSFVAATLITQKLSQKLHKNNVQSFLDENRATNLQKFNQFVSQFGKGKQQEMEQKFVDAGIYNKQLAKYYVPAKLILLVGVIVLLATSSFTITNQVLLGVIATFVIVFMPDMMLAMRKKVLVAKISRQLPYMLDMMSVCIQSGMTIEASLTYLGEELTAFDKDLSFHIRKTADSSKILGLEKSLHELSERIPTQEVRSFTLTLIQNIQYGTSIANVLSALAEDMRNMQILNVEEKIGKLSAKMSVPLILLIMFPIVILILAPGAIMLLRDLG